MRVIDNQISANWYSQNVYEWIQIDMKTQHHVHRVHVRT